MALTTPAEVRAYPKRSAALHPLFNGYAGVLPQFAGHHPGDPQQPGGSGDHAGAVDADLRAGRLRHLALYLPGPERLPAGDPGGAGLPDRGAVDPAGGGLPAGGDLRHVYGLALMHTALACRRRFW
jgi:hypothetical protein